MLDIVQKTRDDYNKIARHFSGTRYDTWPELEQFKSILQDGQYILDWGCGNGRLLLMLRDKKIHYFGVDQSRELLKIAKKKYADLIKTGQVKFFCTAHKEKNFPGLFFDLVFMIASFHHLPDRRSRLKLLKKIFNEMKAGAKLIITVWNLASSWTAEKMKKDWKKIDDSDFLIPWKNPAGQVEAERYYHLFSDSELRAILAEAGFSVETLGYYGKTNWTDKKGGRNLVAVAVKT